MSAALSIRSALNRNSSLDFMAATISVCNLIDEGHDV